MRFAHPRDIPEFTAYLRSLKNILPKRVDDLARMTCCGLKGNDSLMVHDLGQYLWNEYLKERGEVPADSLAATWMTWGPPIKRPDNRSN